MGTAYLIIPLIEVAFGISLLILLLVSGRRHIARRPFLIFLICMVFWGAFIFKMRSAATMSEALVWEKMVLAAILSAPIYFYRFTVRLTGAKQPRRTAIIMYTAYLTCLVMIATGQVVSGMQLMWYGKAPIIGLLFFPYTIFVYAPIVMGLRLLIKQYRQSRVLTEKVRYSYIIVGIAIMIIGGTTDYLPALGVSIYPLGIIGNILFCVLASIAMLKHGLFDMRIALRKGAAYTMTSMLVLGFFAIFIYLFTSLFQQIINPFSITITILAVFGMAVVFQPILFRLQSQVDRWFFGNRYDYLQALRNFVVDPKDTLDLKQLATSLVTTVANGMQCHSTYLLLHSPEKENLATYAYYGPGSAIEFSATASKLLALVMVERDGPIDVNDMEIIPLLNTLSEGDKQSLLGNNFEKIVPLKKSNSLVGALLLGSKLTGQPYTAEDQHLLQTIAQRVAGSIENAYGYERVQREHEELIDNILAIMPNSVMVVNRDLRVVLANQRCCTTFNKPEAEVLQKPVREVCPDDGFYRAILKTFELKQAAYDMELRHHSASEDRIYYTSFIPMGEEKVLMVIQDVTDERKKQERLYLTDRLASIGEMAAGVAHELNNPLAGIVGLSQLLSQTALPAEVKEDVDDIYREAQRAAAIVKNLLTFARKHDPNHRLVQPNEIIEHILKLRAYEQRVNNIYVTAELDPELPEITADYFQIEQVFLNIILNAEQAITGSRSEGHLSITTGKEDGAIKVTFSDDGPGIKRENLNRIFDPFFTTKEVGKGTGLGLSICYGIVAQHGGRLSAESEPERGATFIVELPIKTASEGELVTAYCQGGN